MCARDPRLSARDAARSAPDAVPAGTSAAKEYIKYDYPHPTVATENSHRRRMHLTLARINPNKKPGCGEDEAEQRDEEDEVGVRCC